MALRITSIVYFALLLNQTFALGWSGNNMRLMSKHRPFYQATCAKIDNIFISREFFVATETQRNHEILSALVKTFQANACAHYVFIVLDRDHIAVLKECIREYNVTADVYHVRSGRYITYDTLFRGLLMSNPTKDGKFVVSTADVALPDMSKVCRACQLAFETSTLLEPLLMVMSRKDYHDESSDCTKYSIQGSFDVLIGNMNIVDEKKANQMLFSVAFWGVENVVAFILAESSARVANLCPHVYAEHYHERRTNDHNRIRINVPDNAVNVPGANITSFCNTSTLESIVSHIL